MENSATVRHYGPVLEVLRSVESVPSVRIIVARVLRPFEDNHGRVAPHEAGLTVRKLATGQVLSAEQISTWDAKYRRHLEEKGLVRFEKLDECPTCHRPL
jgi:hypothetical protein